MAHSNIHKQKGRWKNLDIPLTEKLRHFFNRDNFDFSELKERELKIKENIAKREMYNELTENIWNVLNANNK